MTDNAAQAAELVQLAQQHGTACCRWATSSASIPSSHYLETVATDPRFIETHRLSPYPARSTDIGVVLDLMIHDLDVVLAFVKSPVTSVDAVGIPVLSTSEDIANARLRFANGCVANLTASRVSPERMRKIRVFSGGAHAQLHLARLPRAGRVHLPHRPRRRGGKFAAEEAARTPRTRPSSASSPASASCASRCPSRRRSRSSWSCRHFVECVREHQTPVVSGESAKRALDLAFEITRLARQSGQEAEASRQRGLDRR